MLKVSMKALERREVAIQERIPPDAELWNGAGTTLAGPLEVDLVARRVGDGVLVRGSLATTVRLACRRCLVDVEREVDDTVDLLYEPLAEDDEAAGGEVYPLPARGDVLDLAEAVREQVLLRAPQYAVCSETCRGLCPRCGADLNAAPCDCVPEVEPGPWEALKDVEFD
jgi:uncharacterized protein